MLSIGRAAGAGNIVRTPITPQGKAPIAVFSPGRMPPSRVEQGVFPAVEKIPFYINSLSNYSIF